MVTLLTSRWKIGKTTLLSVFLSRSREGGVLAGGEVKPCKVIVVSEEPKCAALESPTCQVEVWKQREIDLPALQGSSAHPRTMGGIHSAHWQRRKPDLVVFDTMAKFLPSSSENYSLGMIDTLDPLHVLTATGAAVLLVHHTRKGLKDGGIVPWGTGSLPAFADILSDLYAPKNAESDRVRRLITLSRLDGLNSKLAELASRTIELSPDGCDYVLLPQASRISMSFEAGWPILEDVVPEVSPTNGRRGQNPEAMARRFTRNLRKTP